MATRRKDEQRILDKDEFEMVEKTHRPHLQDLGDGDLNQLISRLRERRDRARDLSTRRRGAARRSGSGIEQSESSGLRQKSGLLAEAVQRANKERTRRRKAEEKSELQSSARRALKLKRAAPSPKRPSSGRTANRGMEPAPNEKTKEIGSSMEAGRVSQFVRDAQGKRDSR
ncbi:hypothetical protein [Aureimonas mangrovi]|uniref:hypothetical protein n=1 Tax=Aureimonas mangrovi TaxID=2758041 RepID=UPI00163DD9A6|nr:hypothetical protein [Aureimonas mangrovi]